MVIHTRFLALFVVASTLSPAFAQKKPPEKKTPAPAKAAPEQKPPKPGELKKYEDVITKEAKTQSGMFKVHRIEDKVYWEIPPTMLNRALLWQTEIAELPHSYGYPGTAAGIHVIN